MAVVLPLRRRAGYDGPMLKGMRIRNLWLFSLAADVAAVAAAYYTVLAVRFHAVWGERLFGSVNRLLGVRESGYLGGSLEAFYAASAFRIIVQISGILVVLYAVNGLYPGRRFIRRRLQGWNILVANLVALGLFYGYFYMSRNVFHPRSLFATLMAVNVCYCAWFRACVGRLLERLRERYGLDPCPVVLAGDGPECEQIEALITTRRPHGLHVVRRIPGPGGAGDFEAFLLETRRACAEAGAQMLVCAVRGLDVAQLMRILEVTDSLSLPAKLLSDRLDVLVENARQEADRFRGHLLVHFDAPNPVHPAQRCVTRLAAWLLLAVTAPVLLVLALLVRAGSPGPALFVQERIGVNRRPFQMFKFRTMRDRADEMQAQVEELNESGDALFKIKRDPRVTPIGRFLRRFSLDELPQLLNIARGDMVFVGPRPLPRRDFERYYEEWHYGRHAGYPGLTCLWQVSGRSELDFHNMCVLDVYYLRNRNWVLDAKILMRTLWAIVFAKGAY